jgi:hypothetical protein
MLTTALAQEHRLVSEALPQPNPEERRMPGQSLQVDMVALLYCEEVGGLRDFSMVLRKRAVFDG